MQHWGHVNTAGLLTRWERRLTEGEALVFQQRGDGTGAASGSALGGGSETMEHAIARQRRAPWGTHGGAIIRTAVRLCRWTWLFLKALAPNMRYD